MGSCCCRPTFSSAEDIAKARNLDGINGPPDYPRAAQEFTEFGVPDLAIFCWLAADRPHLAQSVYERTSFYIIDKQIGLRIPIWRMIMGVRMKDRLITEDGRDEYLRAIIVSGGSVPTWVDRALSLI